MSLLWEAEQPSQTFLWTYIQRDNWLRIKNGESLAQRFCIFYVVYPSSRERKYDPFHHLMFALVRLFLFIALTNSYLRFYVARFKNLIMKLYQIISSAMCRRNLILKREHTIKQSFIMSEIMITNFRKRKNTEITRQHKQRVGKRIKNLTALFLLFCKHANILPSWNVTLYEQMSRFLAPLWSFIAIKRL